MESSPSPGTFTRLFRGKESVCFPSLPYSLCPTPQPGLQQDEPLLSSSLWLENHTAEHSGIRLSKEVKSTRKKNANIQISKHRTDSMCWKPTPHFPTVRLGGRPLNHAGLQFLPHKDTMPTCALPITKIFYKLQCFISCKTKYSDSEGGHLKNVPNLVLASMSRHSPGGLTLSNDHLPCLPTPAESKRTHIQTADLWA